MNTFVSIVFIVMICCAAVAVMLGLGMIKSGERATGVMVVSASALLMIMGFNFYHASLRPTTKHNVTVTVKYAADANVLIANGWNCTATVINGGWVCRKGL